MFQAGDRVRWETLGDAGLPMVHYGFVRKANGDPSRITIMLDGELSIDRIVAADELAVVTITNIELRLSGADLLDDPALRRGLVSLWSAEADQAGLEVKSLDYLGHEGWGSAEAQCALAELHSGGEHYILRAETNGHDMVRVRADIPHPGEI